MREKERTRNTGLYVLFSRFAYWLYIFLRVFENGKDLRMCEVKGYMKAVGIVKKCVGVLKSDVKSDVLSQMLSIRLAS